MAPIDVVGSHLAPDAFAGQNGDNSSASLLPGQKVRRGKVAQSIVAADGSVSANPRDFQTRPVTSEQVVPTAHGMRSRSGEGGKIPTANIRRAK
jgi:hypothetical protein